MAENIFDLYGIGNAIMDLQVRAEDLDLLELGLTKGAMRLSEPHEQKKIIESLETHHPHLASGGSAANTVIAFSQLGGRTAYGCLVGEDDFGRAYCREMSDLGVILYTRPIPGKVTGTSVILITPDAERTMNTHLGVSSEFGPENVSEEIVSQSSWVYLEGYLLASPAGREAIFRAVELAQKFGVKSALTFSDGFIVDAFGSTIEELTAKVDLVFANFTEASKFTGAADEAEVIRRMKKSVKQGVVTLGADGAEVWYAGTSDRLPGFKASAIDLTGAGDMFAGGFLFGITHGLTSRDSAVLACFLASKVVSQLGPRLNENPRKLALDAGLLSG